MGKKIPRWKVKYNQNNYESSLKTRFDERKLGNINRKGTNNAFDPWL